MSSMPRAMRRSMATVTRAPSRRRTRPCEPSCRAADRRARNAAHGDVRVPTDRRHGGAKAQSSAIVEASRSSIVDA